MELHPMILLYNGMKLQQSFGVRDVKDGVGEREGESLCAWSRSEASCGSRFSGTMCAFVPSSSVWGVETGYLLLPYNFHKYLASANTEQASLPSSPAKRFDKRTIYVTYCAVIPT